MPEPGRGLFVAFEGVEGAGKSTQASRLAARLARLEVPHRLVREPGGTSVGERVREIVLDPGLSLEPETELLLMLAARAEFVRRLVEPALARGEVVVADRYELSTLAYQGLARGLGLEEVRRLNRFATGGTKADAVVLLVVDPEEGRRRAGPAGDRMEGEGEAFHARVDRAYRRLAEEEPEVLAVDGSGDVEEVEARVWESLAGRWPSVFARPEGA